MIATILGDAEAALCPLGWIIDSGRDSALIDRHGDRRIAFYLGYGYAWALQHFSDADVDGVATPRWINLGIEGDTLPELLDALRKLNYPGIPESSPC